MCVAVDLGEEWIRTFDGVAHVDARLAVDVAGGGRSCFVRIGRDINRVRR